MTAIEVGSCCAIAWNTGRFGSVETILGIPGINQRGRITGRWNRTLHTRGARRQVVCGIVRNASGHLRHVAQVNGGAAHIYVEKVAGLRASRIGSEVDRPVLTNSLLSDGDSFWDLKYSKRFQKHFALLTFI